MSCVDSSCFKILTNRSTSVPVAEIPTVGYDSLRELLVELLAHESVHIAHYFGVREADSLRCYVILADDASAEIYVTSYVVDYYDESPRESLTRVHEQVHPFERAITELYGVKFEGSKWDKPLRFDAERFDKSSSIDNYPFYAIDGESLSEVNVGPIHAGIIEPGAFRFVCNGERVLHLEIALGYQHRGIESQMCATRNRLRQMLLAESVAGDSAVAHATAFVECVEKLGRTDFEAPLRLLLERAIALELERVAMHIGDVSGLCADVAYQLGQVACEALRTMTINTTQAWCGNRFGKGLIRPFGASFPLTPAKVDLVRENVTDIKNRFAEVAEDVASSPSSLSRFEECGVVARSEMMRIGAVGVAAKASGLGRDVRQSHGWGAYGLVLEHEPVVQHQGDVMARLGVRAAEVAQSADYILSMLDYLSSYEDILQPDFEVELSPNSLSISLVESHRGEVCHVATTDGEGQLSAYRVADASLHNWYGLALAVRGEGISDFPICNKSFSLSYCGHDL